MNILNQSNLDQLVAKARSAPRKRSHHNFHPTLDATVQRLAIAMEPEPYVRPHRHPQTWELYLPLQGAFKVLIFDGLGVVQNCYALGGTDGLRVFELAANTWHAVVALQPDSVIFEVKEGPYIQPTGADVAAWSPAEGSDNAAAFHVFLQNAQPAQRFL